MTNRPFHTKYHRVFLIIIFSLSHHNYIIISPNMTNRPFHTQYHRVFLIIIFSLSHHNHIIISPNMTNQPFHTQYHRVFLIFRLNLRISATRSLRALCVWFFSKKNNRIEKPKSRWGHVENWNVLGCESSTTKRFPEALEKDITTVQLKLETYLWTEWNL